MFDIQETNAYFQHKFDDSKFCDLFYRHVHDNVEIHYIIKGKGQFNMDGSITDIGPCDLIIVSPHVYHYLNIDKHIPYERIIMNFPREYFGKSFNKDIFNDSKIINLSSHYEIIDTFRKIISSEESILDENDLKEMVKLLTKEIILQLANTKFDNGISKSLNQLTAKIITYIDEHIYEPLSLDKVAEDIIVSKSHLQNTFLTTMKIGVKSYIIMKKMDKAHSLLKQGLRATEVADKLGYDTYSSFYKSYLKAFGQSPKETR